jgi:hypothetical protein
MREKVAEHYAGLAHGTNAAPEGDVSAILDRILAMNDEEAIDVLVEAIAFHKVGGHSLAALQDYNLLTNTGRPKLPW